MNVAGDGRAPLPVPRRRNVLGVDAEPDAAGTGEDRTGEDRANPSVHGGRSSFA